MLTLTSRHHQPMCDGVSRRDFLRIGAFGGVGGLLNLSLADVLRAETALPGQRHKSAILVFLAGGAPHLDMWDMKPEAPAEIRGEFRPMATSVPGIEICELFPEMAKAMDRFAIIRSLTGMVDRHESHSCFSGYTDPQIRQMGHPCLGSAVAKVFGHVAQAVPPFVSICPPTAHRPWGDSGQPGFLGPAYGAFRPEGEGIADMILNGSLDLLQSRAKLLQELDRFRRDVDASGQAAGMDAFQEQALGVLTSPSVVEALQLEREPKAIRERYGYGSSKPVDDGPCADPQHFLIARRLIERGARVVTMAFCRWDWHGGNFSQGRRYMPMLDRGLSALVNDLHERGLANDVTVLVWGEFGRTPRINKDAGRDHWPSANTAVLAGGGLRTGQVIGATDRLGQSPVQRPIHVQEVLATVYQQMGINLDTTQFVDKSGRPMYLLDRRTPVSELV